MNRKLAGAYIDDSKHAALKRMAIANHRTLADQCRHIFDLALSGSLKVPSFKAIGKAPAQPAAHPAIAKAKKAAKAAAARKSSKPHTAAKRRAA